MTLYERFQRLRLDLSPIGLEKGPSRSGYFCTPRGAKVIGWAGVDGIHCCFVRDFGEMVFAVSPMNSPGSYVHPLAKSFEDFLRLLLACGSLAPLEQAHGWDQAQFDAFLRENPPTPEQTAVLRRLADRLSLTPMERPFSYLKALQDSFDYGKIKFPPDYGEWVPTEPEPRAWKVFFNDGFRDHHHGHDRAGKEIPCAKRFQWGENQWYIPAVYVCGAGLVADLCMRVSPDRIRAFMDRWQPWDDDPHRLGDEQRAQMEAESPFSFDFTATVQLGGKTLRQQHGYGASWIPAACLPEGVRNDPETRWVLEHYGLSPDDGWCIRRIAFPWETRRKPVLRSLRLTLAQTPVSFPGPCFTPPPPGGSVPLSHPVTGARHILTVQEQEAQVLDFPRLQDETYDYPTHYTTMVYTLSPDLPDRAFSLRDCARCDPPREKARSHSAFLPEATAGCAVGIIGGADGPTALIFSSGGQAKQHIACSAPRFHPPAEIRWRAVFHEKTVSDISVTLLSPEETA